MESAKRLLRTLLSIVSTRLELLANELQEERLRLTQMFFLALAALFSLGMGVMLLTMFVVVLFWDTHRLAVLGGLCAVFFAAGSLLAWLLRSKALEKPRLFADSISELGKDRSHLGGES